MRFLILAVTVLALALLVQAAPASSVPSSSKASPTPNSNTKSQPAVALRSRGAAAVSAGALAGANKKPTNVLPQPAINGGKKLETTPPAIDPSSIRVPVRWSGVRGPTMDSKREFTKPVKPKVPIVDKANPIKLKGRRIDSKTSVPFKTRAPVNSPAPIRASTPVNGKTQVNTATVKQNEANPKGNAPPVAAVVDTPLPAVPPPVVSESDNVRPIPPVPISVDPAPTAAPVKDNMVEVPPPASVSSPPPTASATPPTSTKLTPKKVPSAPSNTKPRAAIKDGKIKENKNIKQVNAAVGKVTPPTDSVATVSNELSASVSTDPTTLTKPTPFNATTIAAAADSANRNTAPLPSRQRLKDKTSAALHSRPKTRGDNSTDADAAPSAVSVNGTAADVLPATEDVVRQKMAAITSKPIVDPVTPPRPSLDLSHADGDIDVIRSLSPRTNPPIAAASWFTSWMPAHGALIIVFIFTISCVRRVVGVLRGGNASPPSVVRAGAEAASRSFSGIISQISAFNWDKKRLDSPTSDARTRELAMLSFDGDGKSRRRGVKAGMGKSTDANDDAGDIEMQSITSSLASMHIPKMIYLPQMLESSSPPSTILTPQRLQLLLPYFPATSHIQDLALKYSLSVCGASITDLYRRSNKMQDAVTVIQDSAGYIFGCYASSPWKVHDTYYGSADCFVFQLHPHFAVYPASNLNSFFQLANKDSLALGGGDHFALWLDEGFRRGTSKSCQTFNSPSLSSEEEFRCHELEVWSFVDSFDS